MSMAAATERQRMGRHVVPTRRSDLLSHTRRRHHRFQSGVIISSLLAAAEVLTKRAEGAERWSLITSAISIMNMDITNVWRARGELFDSLVFAVKLSGTVGFLTRQLVRTKTCLISTPYGDV